MQNNNITSLFGEPHSSLVGKRLRLDHEARNMFQPVNGRSHLNDDLFCTAWVEYLHRRNRCDFSYGGYLENRSTLWGGSYMQSTNKFIHLGVDVNYKENTDIYCPVHFKVLEIFIDPDQGGGWGGRILTNTPNGYMIFAHLHEICVKENTTYQPMTKIGKLAPSSKNGGTFPHLHIQALRDLSLVDGIDGYSSPRNGLSVDFPEPLTRLGITI